MIFDILFIKIYNAKFYNSEFLAKTVVIVLQSIIISSIVKLFLLQQYGSEYMENLVASGYMRLVYLLPIILSSILTYIFYTERRVKHLKNKHRRYSNTKLNIMLIIEIILLLSLIFSKSILYRFL